MPPIYHPPGGQRGWMTTEEQAWAEGFRRPPVEPKPAPPEAARGRISAGISGSATTPRRSGPEQPPLPRQPTPEEIEEERELQFIELPFKFGLAREMSEQERVRRYQEMQSLVGTKRQLVRRMKDAAAARFTQDPFDPQQQEEEWDRREEEMRLEVLTRRLRTFEDQLIAHLPGTPLSDRLFQQRHPHGWTREKQEEVDERAREKKRFQQHLLHIGEGPNPVQTVAAQIAGKTAHGFAGLVDWLGGDSSALREYADDSMIYAETRPGMTGQILRGVGDAVSYATNPAGKTGWLVGTGRTLAGSYSEMVAETGDPALARKMVVKELPWLAVYTASGALSGKASQLLVPKNSAPLLRGILAFAGAEVIDITAAKAIAIIKGEEYGLQDLTADTLFAIHGSAPWFKQMVTPEVKQKAQQELLARGWSREQLNEPRQFGKEMPPQMLSLPAGSGAKPQGSSLLTPQDIQAELNRAGFGGPSRERTAGASPGSISAGISGASTKTVGHPNLSANPSPSSPLPGHRALADRILPSKERTAYDLFTKNASLDEIATATGLSHEGAFYATYMARGKMARALAGETDQNSGVNTPGSNANSPRDPNITADPATGTRLVLGDSPTHAPGPQPAAPRPPAPPGHLRDLRTAVEQSMADLRISPDVVGVAVLPDAGHITDPAIRDQVLEAQARGEHVEAFYHTDPDTGHNTLVVLGSEVPTLHRTRELVAHEIVGHRGLAALFAHNPSGWFRFTNQLADQLQDTTFTPEEAQRLGYNSLQELSALYHRPEHGQNFDLSTTEGRANVIQEHLARLAELGLQPKWWQNALGWIKKLLQNVTGGAFFQHISDADLTRLLAKAKRAGRTKTPQSINKADAQFSIKPRKFEEAIDDAVAGRLPPNAVLDLGHPGQILEAAGLPNLPIRLRQKTIRKKMTKHSEVSREILARFPEAIRNPMLVYISPEDGKSHSVVTSIPTPQGPITAYFIVRIDSDRAPVLDAKTIFGKNPEEILSEIRRARTDGKLTYANKAAFNEWLRSQDRGVLEDTSHQQQLTVEGLKEFFGEDQGNASEQPRNRLAL